VRAAAMAEQSIKEMIDPKDIAALAVFLTSDAGKSISGQVLPIDNDRQRASTIDLIKVLLISPKCRFRRICPAASD
jgi:hypothetical protein